MKQEIINLIEDLKKTSFYDYYFNLPEVLFVAVSGSNITGTCTDDSDFDFVIVTKENKKIPQKYTCLKYKGKHVHFMYVCIKNLLEHFSRTYSEDLLNTDATSLYQLNHFFFTRFELLLLNSDNIIYKKHKNSDELINLILNKSEFITNCLLEEIHYKFLPLIRRINSSTKIIESDKHRSLHYLCYINDWIDKKDLDIDFLLRIKKITDVDINDDDFKILQEKLNALEVKTMLINIRELNEQKDEFYKTVNELIEN